MTDQQESAPPRDELPLPDYDHLPLESLRHRVRSLDAGELSSLLAYERAHAARLPVVLLLQQRLDGVEHGAPLSAGTDGAIPEAPPAPAGGSPVTPATSGPPINPPSQGDPTNPAQPR